MKGEIRETTIASYHEKIKQKAHDITRPRVASQIMPTDSVDRPFT